MHQIKITFNDGTTEEFGDILQFNFFGNYMVFDLADGRNYLVRPMANIKSYEYKGQPTKRRGKKG